MESDIAWIIGRFNVHVMILSVSGTVVSRKYEKLQVEDARGGES
jgi:hypothetical protein